MPLIAGSVILGAIPTDEEPTVRGDMGIDGARRHCETLPALPNDESSEARARWVVVVPVEDGPLFDYLTKSFAAVPDVSVVLERRRGRGGSETPAHDSRREDRRAQARLVSDFGCAVIRRPPPAAPQTPIAARGRTLLWPHLRISDILPGTEESPLGSVDPPPANGRES